MPTRKKPTDSEAAERQKLANRYVGKEFDDDDEDEGERKVVDIVKEDGDWIAITVLVVGEDNEQTYLVNEFLDEMIDAHKKTQGKDNDPDFEGPVGPVEEEEEENPAEEPMEEEENPAEEPMEEEAPVRKRGAPKKKKSKSKKKPKKAQKSGSKKRKKRKAPTSGDAPAGFSLGALGGFDYAAAVKRLEKAKSSVSVEEIRTCVAEIDYKKRLPAIAAIMCFGCCICNWMLLTICGFVLYVVGPSLVKDFDDFKKHCESVTEYIALKTGEIRELDWEWVKLKKNRDKLDKRSEKKVKARLETTGEKTEEKYAWGEFVQVLYEGNHLEARITYIKPSDGTLSVIYKDGETESGIDPSRARKKQKKPVDSDEDMEVDEEQDADARAVLAPCTRDQLMHIMRDGLEIRRATLHKPQAIDVIVKKLREEALGLQAVWKSNSTQCCPRDRVW